MPIKITIIPSDPNNPQMGFMDWIRGYQTYIVMGLAIAKVWYKYAYGHPWSDELDTAINGTLGLLGVMAIRSAMKTSTAQISNAVVNPGSKEAQAVAAQAPKVPDGGTK